MPRPSSSFTRLAGVPVHYDRLPSAPYGTRGVPERFFAQGDFIGKMDRFFADLWQTCPFGTAEVITSAGAWVEKPGQHGRGRAFDLDGIFWRGKTFVTLHDGFNGRDRKFYFAVESVLRRHFGQNLNYFYNADHRDHFHFDDAVGVGFRSGSRSTVLFVQGALRFIHGETIAVDGRWGPNSRGAAERVLRAAGISGTLAEAGVWRDFLGHSARVGFGAAEDAVGLAAYGTSALAADAVNPVYRGSSPTELLHQVYGVIRSELGTTALRKPVESALDTFANHPMTQEWLSGQGDSR